MPILQEAFRQQVLQEQAAKPGSALLIDAGGQPDVFASCHAIDKARSGDGANQTGYRDAARAPMSPATLPPIA
ncbi:MAG: hypothetical protein WCI65_14695, partial [Synechococcaceae cyanobacterium ELA263]